MKENNKTEEKQRGCMPEKGWQTQMGRLGLREAQSSNLTSAGGVRLKGEGVIK